MLLTFLQTLSLLLPIFISGLFLILCIKKRLFVGLDIPLDKGTRMWGQPLFGANKTYRGILVHVGISITVTVILWYFAPSAPWIHPIFYNSPLILGFLYAAAYSLGELINSFIKRRLAIPAGTQAKRIQYFFDTTDGIILVGCMFVGVYHVAPLQALAAVVLGCGAHLATDALMKRLRLK